MRREMGTILEHHVGTKISGKRGWWPHWARRQRNAKTLIFDTPRLLFVTFWTLSFQSDFGEFDLGRTWGTLGVPRDLLDAPWPSPWTPLGHPSAPAAPEMCSHASETCFSMKNKRLACIRAQLAPPRASVGHPRAPVGHPGAPAEPPKVAHGGRENNFIWELQDRPQNDPETTPKGSQNDSQTDPKPIINRPQTDPTPTPNRP